MAPDDAGQPGRPPSVSLLSHGYQYLTEQRYDQMEPALEIIRRDVLTLGLPLRSVEVEFGPSQCEFTFEPTKGLTPADNMVLFRSAVKQIARRHGYHATFMCRPKLPNMFASGWHLHQSLVSRASGENVFMAKDGGEALSPFGRFYLAGLLEHARASTVFTTPTINGYKRYRSYSLAPDRAIWGRDNRGVMMRVLGGPGDRATRLENRIGEPRGQSLSLHGLADSRRARRHRSQARSRSVGRYALRDQGRAAAEEPARGDVRAAATIRSSAARSGRSSWTTTSTSRRPRSSAFRPRCRTGSIANISRCFEGRRALSSSLRTQGPITTMLWLRQVVEQRP